MLAIYRFFRACAWVRFTLFPFGIWCGVWCGVVGVVFPFGIWCGVWCGVAYGVVWWVWSFRLASCVVCSAVGGVVQCGRWRGGCGVVGGVVRYGVLGGVVWCGVVGGVVCFFIFTCICNGAVWCGMWRQCSPTVPPRPRQRQITIIGAILKSPNRAMRVYANLKL